MKHRGQLIIDEFELLRSVAGKSGLDLPPEYAQGRQLFRERDLLFKKLKLNPNNEHHVAFLCSIVYHHLYSSKPSAAETKYGDNDDFDILLRFLKYAKSVKLNGYSDICRNFVKKDQAARAIYGKDDSINRFRMRLNRAARKALDGEMKLTKKREALLRTNLPEITAFFGLSRKG
ncbi:hypothetical protein [Bradyrhizobium stylosanthis]|uniref:Uncharacterized protein n=1 Tax=Bradyrhizobium stylosanthis TaxID=1803665 RepID=A0A560ECU4_9BRAD|nr:hypothetical protein [Bradyrhizobium stylosanthis]TWB07196.1 hypothetical protein FBZ96_1011014 [Bradyrhizobium stylosanthis]